MSSKPAFCQHISVGTCVSWCSDNYIVHGKGQEGQGEVNTGNASEVSLAIDSIIEEAGHSLGHQLMVVRDEAFLEAIDTFVAEQGAGGELTEDLDKDIIHEAGHCIPLVRGLLHFVSVH